MEETMSSAQGLIDFIAASPSPQHCVAEVEDRLQKAGFTRLDTASEPHALVAGSGGYYRNSGTIVAWRVGDESPSQSGFRMLGAHTDSPNLRLKPNAEHIREGFVQWGVEVYGGVLLSTWMDRDLGLSGTVAIRDGKGVRTELIRVERPIARVPNVAIHLNRTVNTDGLKLNKQKHLAPVVGLAADGPVLIPLLCAELGCNESDILGWELGLHDLVPPSLGGAHEEFIFAPRLDNQASCYTALEGLLNLKETPKATALTVLFDHEECGSKSERGASSAMLRNLLSRLERDHENRAPGGLERALAKSIMISADMAHGVHPNYSDKHEPEHKPRINGGPVIKTNVNMRYATNAETMALFRAACQDEGVPVQDFVTRTDLGCGSTIGPLSASELGVPTVDVGCAMLSMHSIREQTGARDVEGMARVMRRVLAGD
jgi:aspartyl aminopeptidase